jgi:hypothetical protein
MLDTGYPASRIKNRGSSDAPALLVTGHMSLVTSAKHGLVEFVPVVEIVQVHRVFER